MSPVNNHDMMAVLSFERMDTADGYVVKQEKDEEAGKISNNIAILHFEKLDGD